MRKTARSVRFNASLVALGVAFLALSSGPLLAQGLTIEPLTWNVIGLDSNNVNVGPNRFPVGARVCASNVGAVSNLTATFYWGNTDAGDGQSKFVTKLQPTDPDPDPFINLRDGTSDELTYSSLAAGSCTDFYYEVEVTRIASAYNHTRNYNIQVTSDDAATVVTPTPRQLFVEHLISQSRNAVTKVEVKPDGGAYGDVPPGGTMSLMVGQTYWIKLTGKTATNGYEQIESFINLPNTIFQVQSVATTYSADTTPRYEPAPDPLGTRLYTDGCLWVNDPLNPNYRSCVETGKAGGDITVTYKVLVISVPQSPLLNPEALSTLVYDFSGSSYHYNSDFGGSTRYVEIVNASIEKSFEPKALNPNTIPAETSTLTFTITNPGPEELTSVNFVDNLPTNGVVGVGAGQMSLDSPAASYTNCGSPSLTGSNTSLSFSNITVAGLSTCTIAVTVTVNATGTYNNDSENLFINGTIDTGDDAKDTLVATDKPPGPSVCDPRFELATWTMPTTGQGSGGPPPPYTTKATDVATAEASSSGGTTVRISTVEGSPTVNSWEILGGWDVIGTLPNANGVPYFQFQVDTSNYGGAAISFDVKIDPPGAWQSAGTNNVIYVYSSVDGSTWSNVGNFLGDKGKWVSSGIQAATSTGVSLTTFRINAAGAATTSSTVFVDNVTITGCPRPLRPTLAKAFSPASICLDGGYSALTFTFTNPNASALTGVGFTDTLPAGLLINTPNGLTTVTCTPTGSISGQTITATAGGTTVSMSGATLAANSSCSFSVDVQGTVAGSYRNVSGNIESTETGVNTTPTGYGTSDLDVVAPPVIGKAFGASTLITGETTSLTFNITNPNASSSLTGVGFTDNLPTNLVVASPNGLSGSCGGGTIDASGGTISLTSATLTAGSSCTFSVNVTSATAGSYTNSVQVSSSSPTCTGNTATATLDVRDLAPALALLKQVSSSPDPDEPWYDSVIIPAGQSVYYRFTVENTGTAPLTSITIVDPLVSTTTCSWPSTLLVADINDDDHIATCIVNTVTPIVALAGRHPNTAYAQGTYSVTTVNSNNDTAEYLNGNFGHLPSNYLNMNLYGEGGAFHLNCPSEARFGASVTTTDADGPVPPTPDWQYKASDDGVMWTPGVTWAVGTDGGSMDVTVYCAAAPAAPCYVNGWIDWTRDGDFDDAGEHIFANEPANISGSHMYRWTFDIPSGTNMGDPDAVTYYSRFRVYDGLPVDPQPNYRSYSGTTLLCGEIEDPPFTLDGGTTTPVTLAAAGATRDGANVRFAWTTATEVGNVGFNVYGKTATGWRKLNADLIPAVGGGIDPRSYEATIAVPEGVTEFYIEDVDLNGKGTAHGEFTAVEDAAKARGDDPPAGAGAVAGAQGVNPT
jgi:uncharacterized repeat protein (TIGR01451 family)